MVDRPASAIKELIENAIDANATKVSLVIKQSGKELIQVVDNGDGMSAECKHRVLRSEIRCILSELFADEPLLADADAHGEPHNAAPSEQVLLAALPAVLQGDIAATAPEHREAEACREHMLYVDVITDPDIRLPVVVSETKRELAA